MAPEGSARTWTFITNHAAALIAISQNHDIRIRDLAVDIGITERAAQRIVTDLVEEGFLKRTKIGRRNRYAVRKGRTMRHPLHRTQQVSNLIDVLS